jgi:uncharacterized RDD family membrane protein YckC
VSPKLVITFDDEPEPAPAPPEEVGVSLRTPPPPAAPPPVDRLAPPRPSDRVDEVWAPPRPSAIGARPAPLPRATADGQELASWGRRAAALLVDGVIVSVVSVPLIAVLFAVAGDSISGLIAAYLLSSVIPSIVAFAYYPLMLTRLGDRNGQTLGKQALDVRVVSVRPGGPDVTLGQALLREVVVRQILFVGLGALLLWVPLLLDALWPLWQPERRSLHDLAAGTIVVRTDA